MTTLDIIRGMVRPIVTLEVVTTLVVIIARIFWNSSVPEMGTEVYVGIIAAFTTLVATISGFWFAQRSANRNNG